VSRIKRLQMLERLDHRHCWANCWDFLRKPAPASALPDACSHWKDAHTVRSWPSSYAPTTLSQWAESHRASPADWQKCALGRET
jgi:hypothetical protein